MTALSEFTDFQNMSPPIYLRGPTEMVNDAIVQVPLLGRLLLNRDMNQILQGGSTIRDTIKLNVTTTYKTYSPGSPYGGYPIRQSSSLNEIRWRYSRDHMAWTEAELLQNIPAGQTAQARGGVYKKLQYSKEQDLWTSIFNGIEDQLLAPAADETANMESAGGEKPYSLYALINEETNRVANGWTVVQNISRTDGSANATNWQNRRVLYDANQPDDQDSDNDGLLDAFEEMYLTLQFIPPRLPGTEQFFQRSGRDPVKMFIAASTSGVQVYKRRLLERNDTLAGREDPAFTAPKYGGIDVVQVSNLGSATLYDGASTPATESNATTSGSRYFWIDGNFLTPIFHVSKFFDKQKSFVLQEQPDTTVQIVSVWYNLFLNSALRQGIVSPGA